MEVWRPSASGCGPGRPGQWARCAAGKRQRTARRSRWIPNPGDYLVTELPWANSSVLIIRGKDGAIRAFRNICSHRCIKAMLEARGNAPLLRCVFHRGQGELLRHRQSRYGLTPVSCDTWHGFAFIPLDPQPAQSLQEKPRRIRRQLDERVSLRGMQPQVHVDDRGESQLEGPPRRVPRAGPAVLSRATTELLAAIARAISHAEATGSGQVRVTRPHAAASSPVSSRLVSRRSSVRSKPIR